MSARNFEKKKSFEKKHIEECEIYLILFKNSCCDMYLEKVVFIFIYGGDIWYYKYYIL